jgi:hypothetical protein
VVVGPEILMINRFINKICIVIKVYPPDYFEDEQLITGFHYRIADISGAEIDVWCTEVRKI